ncbi:MAG: late competence development ComFB family protein [Spirochaetia bacterium]|jgi:competence protein ComFB|nr:late competence development ComFB family protein [Spirochaetia bacterium]
MGIRESYNFENLVNESERLVLEQMEVQLEMDDSKDICKCQDCVLDMTALALNTLKPHYRVSLIGTVYAQATLENLYSDEVKSAVSDAIKKIADNPSHD